MACDPLRLGVGKLLNDTKLSHFTVRCGTREWAAHKLVLCVQSEYFDCAIHGDFKESRENLIELHEDDPEIVSYMMQWLYANYYRISGRPRTSSLYPDIHVRVYELADKYLLHELKDLASRTIAMPDESLR
ncbi:uncharacterized protein LTR77_009003 [Saxophila tyrrhenica]|uniref:BTB domain-containing protein n=1 Tax=Saxophila tyrrhenica TaxID=1690608 RepID=A0AAV9NZV2_9PEZI|nr:hypothetical protein LTR77_009003 [Saxophila tyrrhenica]